LAAIPDHVVEEIRERADLARVVGRVVTLKQTGNRFWGLCPFHDEKTPSFSVLPERGIFHCFGCGAGGDVFSFRMRQEGIDFPEAVRALAEECGVAIPDARGAGEGQRAQLFEINERALGYFRNVLRSPEGAACRRYLEGRRVPADLLERFRVGFAPPRWDGFLEQIAREPEALRAAEAVGLVARRQTSEGHYDRLRGRVIFPLIEPGGRIVGFGGRGLGDDLPKYLNSPESPIYRKGRVLFGLHAALDAIRKRNRAIVVEGYFDVMALHCAGLEEAVAPCGTALTAEHARRLRRYTREVVLLFDGDEAGQRAAERSLPILTSEGLHVLAAFLPQGEDPDTLLLQQGPAALRACVDSAVKLLDHQIDQALGLGGAHAWKAADGARAVAPLLSVVTDPIERHSYIRRVASRLEIEPDHVEQAVREASGAQPAPAARPARRPEGDVEIELDRTTRVLLESLAAHPDLVDVLDGLEPPFEPAWIAEPSAGQLLAALCGAARERGAGALAALLSPTSDLAGPLATLLAELASNSDAPREQAELALRDCVTRLSLEALERESRALQIRLESCSDPREQQSLLERKQQLLERRQRGISERHRLWGQALGV